MPTSQRPRVMRTPLMQTLPRRWKPRRKPTSVRPRPKQNIREEESQQFVVQLVLCNKLIYMEYFHTTIAFLNLGS